MLTFLYINSMKNDRLHNNVKVARVHAGMSQAQLADNCEVTRQTIIAVEKGDYSPSVLLALQIARALHQPLSELFWLEENQS